MKPRKDELEEFKRRIDLRSYAISCGYEMDARASCRSSWVLSRKGDKVVVAQNTNGHWIFFSVRDHRDNGTILDFIQNRDWMTMGEVRKILRAWVPGEALPPIRQITTDRTRVISAYHQSEECPLHPYLLEDRKIPESVLTDARFRGRIRKDGRRNAIFPHFDRTGVCGFEMKNRSFTGFSSGGEKGLWYSEVGMEGTLVIAESAIDALSYETLFPNPGARYVSTGGSLNPRQPDLLRGLMEKMGEGEVILALDHDPGGETLSRILSGIHAEAECPGLKLRIHQPEILGKDWNDVLRNNQKS
ncbi:MAG: DUF3991 and TOPRIM domain-containing protein [Verrucomicrobiota bacterium]